MSGSEGALLGSGTFYSTAAVVYGRVFLGNTDGRVYAYDASNGKLDWAVQTGAYVYASPAVTNAPGLGPTVYVGSYDGDFYAHQRPLRARQLALQRPRAHLRLGDHHRAHRLLRRPRPAPHLRPRHLHRPRAVRKAHRRLRPGRSATATTSTSPATPACTRSRPTERPTVRPPWPSASISRSTSRPVPNARASEKRAVTTTVPGARAFTCRPAARRRSPRSPPLASSVQ